MIEREGALFGTLWTPLGKGAPSRYFKGTWGGEKDEKRWKEKKVGQKTWQSGGGTRT